MRRVLKARVRRTAIVTLKTGPSFRGVLFDHDTEALVLRNADLLTEGHAPTIVDGEIVILVADVLHLQFP